MKKIVLLGGNGLLGSTLSPYLESLNYSVINLVRNKKLKNDIIFNFDDELSLEDKLNAIRPNFIINLIALTDVDYCEHNPSQAFLVNAKFLKKITSWANNNKDCHLIQISTDQIYDGKGPHSEENVKLINYYAYSKYIGELFARKVPSTIIRTNFFGKSKIEKKSSFTDWIYKSIVNNNKISGFRDVYFNPLSMQTLSGFIELIINRPVSGTFNIGSHSRMSKADFIFSCAAQLKLCDKKISTCSVNDKNFSARRPQDMSMNCDKFKKAYNIKNMPLLADEIKIAMRDYK